LLLTDLLTIDRIRVPLRATTKDDVLREMVDLLASNDHIEARDDILRAVREREAVLSTGVGNGVAIPHGKSPVVPELRMAAATMAKPVEYDALDGQPVRLLFMLVGPETAAGPHIKALSRISRLVRKDQVRGQLYAAASAEDFYRLLQEAERAG
jgi:fructose-specific phosphotransferase system IIA component